MTDSNMSTLQVEFRKHPGSFVEQVYVRSQQAQRDHDNVHNSQDSTHPGNGDAKDSGST
jgi:hypothetical protein